MKDNVNLYTYVANSPVMYRDPMGLEKILIILWIDKDGIVPKIASDLVPDCNRDTSFVCQRYDVLIQELKGQWFKDTDIQVQVASTFTDVDHYINNPNKVRERIYLIAHWERTAINISKGTLDAENGIWVTEAYITNEDLQNDLQTQEQAQKLAETEFYILACNTGKISDWITTIAQLFQDHYDFQMTQAPNDFMWGNWEIWSYISGFWDWKMQLNTWKMNTFTSSH